MSVVIIFALWLGDTKTTCFSFRSIGRSFGCVVLLVQPAVDGGWGEWGPWQPCSRSCGGGVMFSYRECSRPSPQNGGKYCVGQRVNYQSCNKQACENNQGGLFSSMSAISYCVITLGNNSLQLQEKVSERNNVRSTTIQIILMCMEM